MTEPTNDKLLSVSIACFNVEDTIARALRPFTQCNHPEWLDIIVINDASTDRTAQIAQEYAERYPGMIRVIHKENGGWGSTVNRGIEEARGRYFKLLDGDDQFHSEALNRFLEYLKETDADLVITKYETWDVAENKQISIENCNPGYACGQAVALKEVTDFAPYMHSLCVRTKLLKEYPPRLTERCFYTDTEFALKAVSHAENVFFLPMILYRYHRAATGQSMSLAGLKKHYREQETVIKGLIRYRHDSVNREEIGRIFDKMLNHTCYWYYLILFYLPPTLQRRRLLIGFDRYLKKEAPVQYKWCDFWELRMFRKLGYCGYFLLAPHKRKKDARFDSDGRLRN